MIASTKIRWSNPDYLPTLDGWRAIAVTMVCLSHSQQFVGKWGVFNFLHAYPDFGVNLFFAISGILICSRLLDEEKLTGHVRLAGFYTRRAFRILPAAYLYLTTVAVLTFAQFVPSDWHGIRSAALLYRNYLPAPLGDTGFNRLTSHFWSLCIEEHFYLIFPILLIAFPKRRTLLLGLLLVLSLIWLTAYVIATPPAMRPPTWGRRSDLRLWCLLFPALLAILIRQLPTRDWFVRFVTPKLIYFGLFIELVYRFMHLIRNHHEAPSLIFRAAAPIDTSFQPFYFLFVPLLMPFFVLATMLHPSSRLSRALEWRPLRAVGRISYGIYLWQQLFFGTNTELGWPIASTNTLSRAFLVISAISCSYFLIEKPFIRLGHRLSPPVSSGRRDLSIDKLTAEVEQQAP